MGLLTALVTLPLAPLRGTIWIAEQLAAQAERQMEDGETIRRLLIEAEIAFETGQLSEGEYEAVEDELLQRLELVTDLQTRNEVM